MKILFAGVVPGYSWLNDFDDPVNFRCPGADEHVTNFKSIDDQGNKNDRRWDFNCTKGGSEGKQPKVTDSFTELTSPLRVCYCFTGFYDPSTCAWTDYYLRDWEQLHVTRICENGGIVVGLHSVHKNGNEDRNWKFHCCTVSLVSFHIVISEWNN